TGAGTRAARAAQKTSPARVSAAQQPSARRQLRSEAAAIGTASAAASPAKIPSTATYPAVTSAVARGNEVLTMTGTVTFPTAIAAPMSTVPTHRFASGPGQERST